MTLRGAERSFRQEKDIGARSVYNKKVETIQVKVTIRLVLVIDLVAELRERRFEFQ